MINDILSNISNEEKIALFDITLEQAKESGKTFESQISSVITAFLIKKKNEEDMNMAPRPEFVQKPFEMNMAPKPEFVQKPIEVNMAPKPEFVQKPIEVNMAPKPEFVQKPFEMNMAPKKPNSNGDYDGPVLEPIDTQKIENNYSINM